jgi:hypothetical protein
MSNLVYREDLDEIVAGGCGACGCEHDHDDAMFLHCRCDREARGNIEASYRQRNGSVVVGCRDCGRTIVEIAVAAEG